MQANYPQRLPSLFWPLSFLLLGSIGFCLVLASSYLPHLHTALSGFAPTYLGGYLLPTATVIFASFLLLGTGLLLRVSVRVYRVKRVLNAQQQIVADLLSSLVSQDVDSKHGASRSRQNQLPASLLQAFGAVDKHLHSQSVLQAEAAARAQTLEEVGGILSKNLSLQPLAQSLLGYVVKRMELAQGAIFLRKQLDSDLLEPIAMFASKQVDDLANHLNASQGLLCQIKHEAKPIYLEEVPAGFLTIHSGLGQSEPSVLMLLPILFEGTLIGVLEVAAFHALSPEQQTLLEAIATKTAATFYNQLQSAQTHDLLEESRLQAKELLEQSQQIARANEAMRLKDRAINSSSSSIVIVDAQVHDKPIIYVNPAFTQTTGYTAEEVLGKNCRFLQGDDKNQEGLTAIREGLAKNQECQAVLRNFRKDGSLFWNELTLSPVVDEQGVVTHYVGVQNDITDKVALEEAEQKMRSLNEGLEGKVHERTKELEDTLEELKTTQHRMVQSEKLASMGQLIAGVAHEINTPLGAIKASVVNMEDSLPQALQLLPELVASLEGDAKDCFLALTAHNAKSKEMLTTRDERKIRKEMAKQLEHLGIAEAFELAQSLFNAGIRGQVADYLPILQHPRVAEILLTAYHLSQLKTNMAVINHAADKTRKTVYALKRYSHFQQEEHSEQAELMDIIDSIEVVLTLYHNQLKHGVEVTTDISPLPKIYGYSDELGQVWTNIIHNAAQAMEYNGKLHVSAKELDGQAIVQISDNGPGIPDHVLPRIFEPFFTTKRQGEGTGLGLDICKKIVEKHKGTIEVETSSEGTLFTICIPLAPESALEAVSSDKVAIHS